MQLLRAVTVAVLCCAGLTLLVPAAAVATGEAATLCTNIDPRLAEASGLVVTQNGYAAVNDGGNELTVYLLDRECAVIRALRSPEDPFDPEDLARTDDGTLWVADIGDNDSERETVVIWQVNPSTGAAIRHRLAYPDGAHDAEALLMPGDKAPVIVTKEPSGVAKVYVAARPLAGASTATVPLRAAGAVTITPAGTTGGPAAVGPAAGVLVTGGAVAPDGKHFALRTYTDVYEWALGSDELTAKAVTSLLTSADPARTPLPGEPQGESISYTFDNSGFVTLSEGAGQPLQQWKPVRAVTGSSSAAPDDSGGGIGLLDLNRANVLGGIYAVAVIGVVLFVAGVVGISRWRRKQAVFGSGEVSEGADDVDAEASAPLLYPPTPAPAQLAAPARIPTVPGAVPPAGVGSRGTVYGSGAAQGRVYGDAAPLAVPPAGTPHPPSGQRGTVYGGRSGSEDPQR
ncbi:MAG: hypothetical protein ACRDPW_07090 [Mycobacteriales bacterium]